MRRFLVGTLTGAALALTPVAAIAGDQTDMGTRIAALDAELDEAYGLDYSTQQDEARERLLAVAREAEALLENGDLDEETRLDLLALVGEGYFGAAQHHDSEPGEPSDALDREWLIKTVTALEPVLAARGSANAPAYDFRGAAGQLVNHGRNYDLPELAEWARMRVLGNRYMREGREDDSFERQLLAESLYDYGWITGDDALIAEANALCDEFPEDDRPYSLRRKRDAIAAGESPL